MPEALQWEGYDIKRFLYQPGLENALPEGKNGTIKVFGDLPEGWDISDVLGNIDLDPEVIIDSARVSIVVAPPGNIIKVTVLHGDIEYTQKISTNGIGTTVIKELTTKKVEALVSE